MESHSMYCLFQFILSADWEYSILKAVVNFKWNDPRALSDRHQILHDDKDIGANLNYSQKLRKCEIQDSGRPPFWKQKIRTRPRIVRPDYMYITRRCTGLSASAEILVWDAVHINVHNKNWHHLHVNVAITVIPKTIFHSCFIDHIRSCCLPQQVSTRSSADADNRLDAFSSLSRSTNKKPFSAHCDFSLSMWSAPRTKKLTNSLRHFHSSSVL